MQIIFMSISHKYSLVAEWHWAENRSLDPIVLLSAPVMLGTYNLFFKLPLGHAEPTHRLSTNRPLNAAEVWSNHYPFPGGARSSGGT